MREKKVDGEVIRAVINDIHQSIYHLSLTMRKSAITERFERHQFFKAAGKSHAQDLYLQNIKLEPSRIPDNNFMSSKNPHPYYHPKTIKQLVHRPLTTQKHQSFIEHNRSKLESMEGQSHGAITMKNEPAKQLSISTMREHQEYKQRTTHYENSRLQHSKGRLFRGSSWKYDDKPYKEIHTSSARYNNNHKKEHQNHENKQHQAIKARKSRGLIDLLGHNLRKSENKPDDDFFQYIMRFSYRTKKGYIPTNSGKVNQDSYIINPNLNNHTWQHFFAVCDGHGPLGHHVSAFIKNSLPQVITNSKGLQRHPKEAITRAFEVAYQRLLKESGVDLNFSGSTIISCFFNHNRLICANVGDSRAILGRCRSGNWEAVPLSTDHKPNLEKEAERIKNMRGRIQAFKDQFGEPIGPLRVWVQGDNVPGLAMTRSFGDLVGASVGVSPIPQIKQFNLTEQDRIVVIGSDGIFQFLENETILKSLVPFYEAKQIQQASDHLMSLATKSWNKNSSIVDDITFILIFISYNEM